MPLAGLSASAIPRTLSVNGTLQHPVGDAASVAVTVSINHRLALIAFIAWLVTATPFVEWGGTFSPDGKWIAYTREAGGTPEVHVRSYPDPGTDTQISIDGGEEPIWSPKGDEIFYRSQDRWMAVPVTVEPELKTGPPELLFRGDYLNIPARSYDYDSHRERFLLVEPRKEEPVREIRLVLNWFEELKRRISN